MGWARTFLLGDVGNRLDIGECEKMIAELYRASAKSNRGHQAQETSIDILERENGELKLCLAGLVRLLIAKEVFTADEFGRLVDIIDAEDGAMDGQHKGDLA